MSVLTAKATPRTERAPLRPFSGLKPAEEALESVTLVVDGEAKEPGPISVAADQLATAKFTVTLPDVEKVKDLVAQTPVPVVDCGLVVMIAGNMHRGSARVLVQQNLMKADYPSELEIARGVADLAAMDTTGFTVTVAVVLLHDLQPAPLRPFMAGTWLARQVFAVTPERDLTAFAPEPLTEDVRTRNALREGVTRFVEVEDATLAESLSDAVRLYVDPDVLSWLNAKQNTPTAKQIMIDLAIQTYTVAAAAFIEDIRVALGGTTPSASDLVGYPVAEELFSHLATLLSDTKTEVDIDHVIGFTAKAGLLAAHLEAALQMRAEMTRALKGLFTDDGVAVDQDPVSG